MGAATMSRPEHQAPPQEFYNADESRKYTDNSRVQSIQAEMTYRCLELLDLPQMEDEDDDDDEPTTVPSLLLDIGAGSGLSGEILTDEGHHWVGCDISGDMLERAIEREVEGDLLLADIGQGFAFRPGSFDGAISVSVLQWLCNADAASHSPPQRLLAFFTTLYSSLRRGARAVFQFYPESDAQATFIMGFANRAGFGGGLVVDYPNSAKKKKFYLVLTAGQSDAAPPRQLPAALGTEDAAGGGRDTVAYENRRAEVTKRLKGKRKTHGVVKDASWVKKKKDLYRSRGKEGVPRDSKYTARKRKPRF